MIVLNTNNINLKKFGFVLFFICFLTNEIVKITNYTRPEIIPLVIGSFFIIKEFITFRKK